MIVAMQIQEHVSQYMRRLWQRQIHGSRRIGMAISGGVDSMALATLCNGSQSGFKYTGFIVDHGVRRESSSEAAKVADELQRIGIEPRVLRLDWSAHGNPKELSSFEAVARRLRYQAIGKACYSEGIQSLFVGHHADDQAETVLTRIVSGYLGAGLAGIHSEAGIPECAGIYGVDGSGWGVGNPENFRAEGLQIERGGVNIHRPLLPFTKDELIQVCRREHVKWFDDPTNADQMLTIRNTIRHLHQRSVLPTALQRSRLVSVALAVKDKTALIDAEVDRLLALMGVELDLRLGKVTLTIEHEVIEKCNQQFTSTMHRIKAVLLRKLMQLVINRDVLLQDLQHAVEVVFSKNPDFAAVQIGKVNIQPEIHNDENKRGHKSVVLCRQKPSTSDLHTSLQLTPQSMHSTDMATEWHLWDQRYWLRLQCDGNPALMDQSRISARFFTPTMLGFVRKTLDKQQRLALNSQLEFAKAHGLIWTLPVIVAQTSSEEHVVSLPSLGWENPAFRKWHAEIMGDKKFPFHIDIRYKSVDLGSSEKNKVIS